MTVLFAKWTGMQRSFTERLFPSLLREQPACRRDGSGNDMKIIVRAGVRFLRMSVLFCPFCVAAWRRGWYDGYRVMHDPP